MSMATVFAEEWEERLPHPLMVVAEMMVQSMPRYECFCGGADDILDLLRDDSEGSRSVQVESDAGLIVLQANHIRLIDWTILSRVAAIAERYSDWADEGWNFSFELLDSLEKFLLPSCDSDHPQMQYYGNYRTIEGNMYDSNADTWGSQLGAKGRRTFLFYLPELQKYGVVYGSYWVL